MARRPGATSPEQKQDTSKRSTPLPRLPHDTSSPTRPSSSRVRRARRVAGRVATRATAQAQQPLGPLRVIPLGGVGEVGKNSMLVEYGDDLVMIDAGVMFPEEELFGVDLVIPDVTYVLEQAARLRAILLTHGHEDHIGALPFVVAQLAAVDGWQGPIPIYGSPLTLGLVELKLRERRAERYVSLRAVAPGERIRLGKSLEVEFFRVAHSIPDSMGLLLRTPAGTVVHSGDFKFDRTPVSGPPTNIDHIRQVGDEGVLVLLCDSVRADRPGHTPSERVVMETLERLIADAPGRVLLTTFASNITRIEQAIHSAHAHGRKAAVVGRSMEGNLNVAQQLGYLDVPAGALVPVEQTRQLPPKRVLLITTGSQGEPASVLSRIAAGTHREIQVQSQDTVIVAASPVPGNEETVSKTVDNLFRRGARVLYRDILDTVHVSGHASQEELRSLIDLLRPRYCVPFHGEYRHMVFYRDLAAEAGIPESQVLLPDIGEVLEFGPDYGRKAGNVTSGSVLVDGIDVHQVGRVTDVVLRDRRRLAGDGLLIVSVIVDRESGDLVSGPDILARGFVDPTNGELLEEAAKRLRRALAPEQQGQAEFGYLVQRTKEVLASYINQQIRSRPLILPVITEL